jgi:hypothetical protein
MSLALHCVDEPIPDTIPLTASEKRRKAELETIVEAGLEEFLRVGSALAELRNRRLYRVEFATFAEYVRVKFGMARSSVDQIIRSSQTAETLLEAGVKLSPGTTEAVIRPISSLPGDELQAACWQLATELAPERGPTQPLVSKLCRVVRNCLDGVDEQDNHTPYSRSEFVHTGPRKARSVSSPEREVPFVRPVERLAAWSGFSVEIVVSNVKPPSALTVFKACGTLALRCKLVQERLVANYPELGNA